VGEGRGRGSEWSEEERVRERQKRWGRTGRRESRGIGERERVESEGDGLRRGGGRLMSVNEAKRKIFSSSWKKKGRRSRGKRRECTDLNCHCLSSPEKTTCDASRGCLPLRIAQMMAIRSWEKREGVEVVRWWWRYLEGREDEGKRVGEKGQRDVRFVFVR